MPNFYSYISIILIAAHKKIDATFYSKVKIFKGFLIEISKFYLAIFFKEIKMKLDKASCLCPYCGEKLPKKNCDHCSHKDFIFEDVCFCPHCEAYFMQEEPLHDSTKTGEGVIFPDWQSPRGRYYQ